MIARRRLTASQSFAIAVALLVVAGVLGTLASLIALSNLNEARVQLTDRLTPAVISASDFSSALIDQETGVRGYALTADPTDLDPYESGLRDEVQARDELERLSRQPGLERFQGDIAAIFAAARGWQQAYALPTIALVKSDPARARTPAAIGAGKARFDGLRRSLGAFRARLAPIRAEARDTLDRNASYVLFWVLGTGIVILITVGAVTCVLRRTIVVPVQRLADAVRGVARGDFEREVRGSGAHEVVDLGEDVDGMRAQIVSELEALRVAESDLRRSNAELEQFAYVASHDLQEPLRKVASFCQLLQQRYQGQLDARADQYIGFAVDGATRMQDLINDLLAFSRVGRMEQPHTDVDCEALMSRVRADLGRLIEETGAELVVGPLPTVRGDAGLLRVVFQNLCANALKFRGEAAPVIHIDAEPDGAFWRFRAADNGIGIEPEYAERIFVLFQRLHPRTQYEGTGIGLAMCRKIVEHHGGRMWLDAENAAGKRGSTFYFTLPMEPETR